MPRDSAAGPKSSRIRGAGRLSKPARSQVRWSVRVRLSLRRRSLPRLGRRGKRPLALASDLLVQRHGKLLLPAPADLALHHLHLGQQLRAVLLHLLLHDVHADRALELVGVHALLQALDAALRLGDPHLQVLDLAHHPRQGRIGGVGRSEARANRAPQKKAERSAEHGAHVERGVESV
ncbi:hypothetical protein DFJ74DRAFT_26884 [Hyaloraphidium curvatum]|nr:hypothetical protein DFJ74DRAFT_26884 [Hyaloraphidium curvatum]